MISHYNKIPCRTTRKYAEKLDDLKRIEIIDGIRELGKLFGWRDNIFDGFNISDFYHMKKDILIEVLEERVFLPPCSLLEVLLSKGQITLSGRKADFIRNSLLRMFPIYDKNLENLINSLSGKQLVEFARQLSWFYEEVNCNKIPTSEKHYYYYQS